MHTMRKDHTTVSRIFLALDLVGLFFNFCFYLAIAQISLTSLLKTCEVTSKYGGRRNEPS